MWRLPQGWSANYIVKGIKLDSQSFSLGLGDNKSVSLSFSTQIGGPEQSGLGVFMSGYYQASTSLVLSKIFNQAPLRRGFFLYFYVIMYKI